MKTRNLLLAAGIFVGLSLIGRADTVYTDTFNSDSPGYNTPVGWNFTGYGSYYQNGVYLNGDAIYVGDGNSTNGTGFEYAGISGVEGAEASFLVSKGDVPSDPNSYTVTPGPDPLDFFNSNVGAKFAANTTYTLNYLEASQAEFNYTGVGPATFPFGTQSVSLEANGVVIGTSTQSITTDAMGAFVAGQTVTVDTGLDTALVGQNIGIDALFLNTSDTGREVGFDDFVLTDALDSLNVPEPSTYALMGLGLGMLALTMRKRRSAS